MSIAFGGLFLILGAVILVGTLVVGGAVMVFKLLRRPENPSAATPPPAPPRPDVANAGQPPRLPGT